MKVWWPQLTVRDELLQSFCRDDLLNGPGPVRQLEDLPVRLPLDDPHLEDRDIDIEAASRRRGYDEGRRGCIIKGYRAYVPRQTTFI